MNIKKEIGTMDIVLGAIEIIMSSLDFASVDAGVNTRAQGFAVHFFLWKWKHIPCAPRFLHVPFASRPIHLARCFLRAVVVFEKINRSLVHWHLVSLGHVPSIGAESFCCFEEMARSMHSVFFLLAFVLG